MELFLNVVWLLLAVPALWVWRREAPFSGRSHAFRSLRCALILGGALMLLFPVVSATDDLHAMRPEMEESTPSKRAVKPLIAGKAPVWLSGSIPSPVELTHPAAFYFSDQAFGIVVAQPVPLPHQAQAGAVTGRAPPISRLDSFIRH